MLSVSGPRQQGGVLYTKWLAVKKVYYPKYNSSRPLYEAFRNKSGGYGGLFSVTFHSIEAAVAFFDQLEVLKGPSLGTNFTLR